MARRLRLQFPGARYHIINRGNFRQRVFSTAGAAEAFVARHPNEMNRRQRR